MQVQSPAEVLARIEAVHAAERARGVGGIVATDGDGTLWSGDIGEDFYFAFCDGGRIEKIAEDALLREAREHGVDTGGATKIVARRIYEAYVAGAFPEERVCELMTWCFAGWSKTEVRDFAHAVASRIDLASRIHGELREVLDGVRRLGVEIFVVSASPRAIVEEAARIVGVPLAHVVAADPLWKGDAMIADVARPIPYGAGKVHGLRARVGDRPLLAAFGDNAFDVALLAEANVKVAVRPKLKLRERAHELPTLVELARSPG